MRQKQLKKGSTCWVFTLFTNQSERVVEQLGTYQMRKFYAVLVMG